MSAAQTTVAMTRALAWPVVVLVSVVVLRQQLRGLLSGLGQRVAKIKAPGLELEFLRVSAETEAVLGVEPKQQRLQPAQVVAPDNLSRDPTATVLAEYERVGSALKVILERANVVIGESATPLRLATIARQRGLIGDESVEAVRGVAVMRNLAAHNQGNIDANKARDYTTLVDATIFSFRNRADRSEPPNPPTDLAVGLTEP